MGVTGLKRLRCMTFVGLVVFGCSYDRPEAGRPGHDLAANAIDVPNSESRGEESGEDEGGSTSAPEMPEGGSPGDIASEECHTDCSHWPSFCVSGVAHTPVDYAFDCSHGLDTRCPASVRSCRDGCSDYIRTDPYGPGSCAEDIEYLGPLLGEHCGMDYQCRWPMAVVRATAGSVETLYRGCVNGGCRTIPPPEMADFWSPCLVEMTTLEVVSESSECGGGKCYAHGFEEFGYCTGVCEADDQCPVGALCDLEHGACVPLTIEWTPL